MIIEISKSNKSDKKLKAVINDNKTIHFGSSSHSDFTKHNDPKRKELYINRHKERENWTKSGVDTAGYLSRFVLWNKPSIEASIVDLNKKYKDVKFVLKK